MKIVVTTFMVICALAFIYALIKDAKFSSLDFRKKKNEINNPKKKS